MEGFLRYWIGGGDLYFEGLMKTLVIGNLFKPFRLAITFAREVYHLGIKMKTNMTIAFFSLSPTANCPYECERDKYKVSLMNKISLISPRTQLKTVLLKCQLYSP